MRVTLREWAEFGASIVLSLALLASNDDRPVQLVRATAISFAGAVQEQVSRVTRTFGLSRQVARLMSENAALLLELARYRDAALENQRLRALLGFKERAPYPLLPAEVVAHSGNSAIHSITINVGSADGVRRDAPVVTSQGLVGKVYLTGSDYSLVHVLLDRNFRAAAMVERSRVHGILRWSGGDYCLLDDVPIRSDVRLGDVIVTSGLGGIFPPGIRIGVVVQVSEDATSLFKQVYVKPYVDFSRLEEVAVILPAVHSARVGG
ncbi:MAG: rod shape-determining protein MreC [candidate division KSB1 bacterium]|nr:rod shape-determining protein MreC [candidate division KSB1 bacterium]